MFIACTIRPFDAMQLVSVYDENGKVDSRWGSLPQIEDTIFELIDKYENITSIELNGAKAFSEKVKEAIEKKQITKYSNNKITINIH